MLKFWELDWFNFLGKLAPCSFVHTTLVLSAWMLSDAVAEASNDKSFQSYRYSLCL